MNGNVTDYESICEDLDRLSLQMLEAMKEYIDCKVIIENYIKTGCLHLAKARYIMGNKSVSSLQLPTEDCDILAQTKVSHTQQNSGSSQSLVFEINRLSLEDNDSANDNNLKQRLKGKEKDEADAKESKSKTSKKKQSDDKVESEGDNEDSKNKNDKTQNSAKTLTMSQNPMKWFGVLVPQNLKYAQTNFSTVLDYVVQCTNIQSEMDSIRTRYLDLLKLKKDLSKNEQS